MSKVILRLPSCRLIALDSQTQKCTSADKGFNTLKENKYPNGIKGSNVNASFLTSSLQLHLQSVLAFVNQSKRKIYSKFSVCCCCYQSDYAFWSESQSCANCAYELVYGNELVVQSKRISTTSALFIEVNGQYVLETSEQKILVSKLFNLTYKKWGVMSVQ